MSLLSDIKPTSQQRIIDLVHAAGVDVSDWANFKGQHPSQNPRYCYEWAFIQPGEVVVLCLWHSNTEVADGTVYQDLNGRDLARWFAEELHRSVESRRATRFDEAIQTAIQESLPIRVVMLEGQQRDLEDKDSSRSEVNNRLLDPVPWAATAYDDRTGRCRLTRGGTPSTPPPQGSDAISQSKFFGGGESSRHRELKERVAENPSLIGLPENAEPSIEHQFFSPDRADIVFRCPDGRRVAVEVELEGAANTLVGAWQAAKYRTLLALEHAVPTDSDRIKSVLVAHEIPESTREFCNSYDIQFFELD